MKLPVALLVLFLASGCSTTAGVMHISDLPPAVQPLRYVIVGDREFRSEVSAILESQGSWTSELVVKADTGPVDFYIWLTYPDVKPPCWDCNFGNMVAIGTEAWFNGAHKGPGMANELAIPTPEWRRFVINHEVGHQLGWPDNNTGPCSIMNPRVCPAHWPIDVDDYLRAQARDWLATRSTV